MLDSLLNREHKRITLDRLIIQKDHQTELIINQQQIEELIINHFKYIGKDTTQNNDAFNGITLPDRWHPIYYKSIPPSLKNRNSLNADITIEELNTTIKKLPCNKATGTS